MTDLGIGTGCPAAIQIDICQQSIAVAVRLQPGVYDDLAIFGAVDIRSCLRYKAEGIGCSGKIGTGISHHTGRIVDRSNHIIQSIDQISESVVIHADATDIHDQRSRQNIATAHGP